VIAILDYDAGNLTSVKKAVDHLGYPCVVTSDQGEVERADKILLPGVGHFSATSNLEARGLSTVVRQAIARGTPLLGICLGMQWMFECSEEAPEVPGVAWFRGRCQRFSEQVKVPHVGWNQLQVRDRGHLFRNIPSGTFMYFTHSYWAPVIECTTAECEYGSTFSAAIERGNLFGVQFHPEKSGDPGLTLLRNFCEL
jgi:imidazole glycerol-phosphate synthase subunit HisH